MRRKLKQKDQLLIKADRVCGVFHQASLRLSKALGRVLHHLLMGLPFDFKSILGGLAGKEVYDLMHVFEKSQFCKKKRIFRKMKFKLSFFKQIKVKELQSAFERLSLASQEQQALKGEFSVLDQSKMMMKSIYSSRVQESMNETFNMQILDGLDDSLSSSQDLIGQVGQLVESVERGGINDIPLVLMGDLVKGLERVV